ncbi:MAG: MMPL family transporter, partial [Pseudomonadota bacterium]
MTVVNGAAAPPAATWAQTYARRIRQWRFPILAVWLALAVAGIMGGDKVRYDPDVLVYFDEDREERQAFDDIEARFGQSREVVTLIRSRDGDVFAPDILRAMAAMAVATAERPEVTALRSPLGEVDLLPQAVLDADDDTLREAGERLRQAVATGGTGEDGRIRTLVAADGSVAAVAAIVPANLGNEEAREVAAAHAALKSAVSAQHPSAEFLQTGRIMIDDAFLRESQDDVNGYAGVQLLILATLVFAALGSLSLGLIVMFLVLLTLTGSAGALGWSGIQVNGISSAAPVVLMGLVVASAIHVAMAWQEALRSGADKVSALATAMDRNAKPVALSVLTTLVSFLLLNIAEAPPFRDLGNIVALGLLGILALMFTLLPAFLT